MLSAAAHGKRRPIHHCLRVVVIVFFPACVRRQARRIQISAVAGDNTSGGGGPGPANGQEDREPRSGVRLLRPDREGRRHRAGREFERHRGCLRGCLGTRGSATIVQAAAGRCRISGGHQRPGPCECECERCCCCCCCCCCWLLAAGCWLLTPFSTLPQPHRSACYPSSGSPG